MRLVLLLLVHICSFLLLFSLGLLLASTPHLPELLLVVIGLLVLDRVVVVQGLNERFEDVLDAMVGQSADFLDGDALELLDVAWPNDACLFVLPEVLLVANNDLLREEVLRGTLALACSS